MRWPIGAKNWLSLLISTFTCSHLCALSWRRDRVPSGAAPGAAAFGETPGTTTPDAAPSVS
eukprot:1497842-Lingulodinium_polyedra.AAC.1